MKCICCGKEYKYNHGKDPAWGFNYCGEKCREIDKLTADFLAEKISNERMKSELKNLGVTDLKSCPSGVKSALKSLFETNKQFGKNNDKK